MGRDNAQAAVNAFSFLPDDYVERRERRRSNILCAGLAVVVLGLVGAAVLIAQKSVARLEGESAAVDARYTEAAKRIELVKQLQVQQRTLAGQVELTACLIDRVPRSHLLAELTNALPKGVSLLEFDMQSKVRPPAPAPSPPPASGGSSSTPAVTAADAAKAVAAANRTPKRFDVFLKVQGMAMTDVQVAAFIAHLGQSRMFRDVNLLVSEEFEVGKIKARKFVIDLQLNPDATVGTAVTSELESSPTPGAAGLKGGAL